MSRHYRSKNTESTAKLYYKNTLFVSRFMDQINTPHVMDFNREEKLLFGRIDTYHMPIVALQDSLRSLEYYNGSLPVKTLGFVSRAFTALAKHFKTAATRGQIDANDPYLGRLVAYKGYENPLTKYREYQNSWYYTLAKNIKDSQHKIVDFSDLTNSLKEQLINQNKLKRHPWTFPAFMKSRLCPISCSGLAIEIADVNSFPCSNDDKKIGAFYESPNWKFYVNACNQYGFMIDMNAPWRIVADIDSEAMKRFAAVNATQLIIRRHYRYAYPESFNSFDSDLLRLYNLCKSDRYTEKTNCSESQVKVILPKNYTLSQLQKEYSDEFFIELWLIFRFSEEESEFSKAKINMMTKSVISRYRSGKLDGGLFSFEKILNKPFDYVGSMTYNRKAAQLREDEGNTSEEPQQTFMGGY